MGTFIGAKHGDIVLGVPYVSNSMEHGNLRRCLLEKYDTDQEVIKLIEQGPIEHLGSTLKTHPLFDFFYNKKKKAIDPDGMTDLIEFLLSDCESEDQFKEIIGNFIGLNPTGEEMNLMWKEVLEYSSLILDTDLLSFDAINPSYIMSAFEQAYTIYDFQYSFQAIQDHKILKKSKVKPELLGGNHLNEYKDDEVNDAFMSILSELQQTETSGFVYIYEHGEWFFAPLSLIDNLKKLDMSVFRSLSDFCYN